MTANQNKMKRVIFILIFICCNLFRFSFAQMYFKYNNTIIYFSNNFIYDSARKVSPIFIQSPFETEHFVITGPVLGISINETSKENRFHGTAAGIFIDSSKTDSNLFNLKNLQTRITINNKINSDWNDVYNSVSFLDTLKNVKGFSGMIRKNYWIFNDTLKINDSILLEIRNKNILQQISSYSIKRIALPVTPFLAMMWHDSASSNNTASFIQSAIEKKEKEMNSINSFYAYWPPLYGSGNNGEKYFPSSKLAFYFRKQNVDFPDSSLEYKLTNGDEIDNTWHKTGHLIIIPKLQSNTNYTLLVRYINYPKNIWEKTFYVLPQWYQTNTFKFITGIVTAFLLMVLIFIFYNKKLIEERKRKAKLSLELKAIRSQLNPHFIFNALSSIQGLINSNKINDANYYLSGFSDLMRNTLAQSDKIFQPLEKEIAILETYIKIEQLRFGFKYEMNVDANIKTNEIEIPSLLLQPLVENAIKHGVSALREKGNVTIHFFIGDNNLIAEIKDNGAGFDDANKNGFGWQLTNDRITLLNKMNKEQSIDKKIFRVNNETVVQIIFKNII